MKVGVIQQHNGANHTNNTHRLQKRIRQLAHEEAELIALQELHNGLYFCQTGDVALFDQAETIPGSSTKNFRTLARELGVMIALSLFKKRATGLYHNTAVVFERNGSIAGRYRKMRIPDGPAYYEKFYFASDDLGFEPVGIPVGRLGILICWDQRYSEAARFVALKDAELLIYPAAIDTAAYDMLEEQQRQIDARQLVQRGYTVANNLPVIAMSRVDSEPDPSGVAEGIQFWGHSFVTGQRDEVFCNLSQAEEAGIVMELGLERTELVRRWWPYLRDRRIDSYGEITCRYID